MRAITLCGYVAGVVLCGLVVFGWFALQPGFDPGGATMAALLFGVGIVLFRPRQG